MSVTSSAAPAFADPLAQEGVQSPPSRAQGRQGAAKSERAALLAPDVEGCLGAEAIELVRARGLIAAIETVEITGSLEPGCVIEQDPPAGSRMVREGVLTLQVAQAPSEPEDTGGVDPAAESHAESSTARSDGGVDDTEEWFASLGPALDGPVPGAGDGVPRRRRKHRRTPVPVEQMVFDRPPDPLPAAGDPLPEAHRDLSPQPAGPRPWTSAMAALLVRLSALSVSPSWRRRAFVVAGAVVGLVVLTRSGGFHSHHHVSASLAQAPAAPLRAASTPVVPRPRSVRRTPHGRRMSRRPAAPTRRPRSGRGPRDRLVATASAATPVSSASGSSGPPPVPPGGGPGPFVYLGK
jgi:hypothetical protein